MILPHHQSQLPHTFSPLLFPLLSPTSIPHSYHLFPIVFMNEKVGIYQVNPTWQDLVHRVANIPGDPLGLFIYIIPVLRRYHLNFYDTFVL